jgi:hypothetical protein
MAAAPAAARIRVMTLVPKTPADLALAPVAAGIDINLQALRDKTPEEIDYELSLQLDQPLITNTRQERAEHVERAALRGLDLHGWHIAVTDDGCRLRLSGGSVTLDLGLGAALMSYITTGVRARAGV